MKRARLTVGMLALVGAGGAGFGLHEYQAASAAVEAQALAQRRSGIIRDSISRLETKLRAETKQAEAVERDNAALARALQDTQAALAKAAAMPVSRETFGEQVKKALGLAPDADADLALRELLWCYDTGVARPDLTTSMQMSTVVTALGKLGERQPAALAALRERFDQARRRVLGSPDDLQPLGTMSSIARTLGDDQAMVAVYDAIPPGDDRRKSVAIYAQPGFIAARRYSDALMGRPYSSMSSSFELQTQYFVAPKAVGIPEQAAPRLKAHMVTSAATNIEILAGAGDLAHARELAARLLAVDNSQATRDLLQQHLERAGQPGLLTPSKP